MEWSRKGQIVSSIQTHRKIRKTAKGNFTESTLVLTNVSKVDNGTYTCTVTTSKNMGYSNQATATLLVTGMLAKAFQPLHLKLFVSEEWKKITSKICVSIKKPCPQGTSYTLVWRDSCVPLCTSIYYWHKLHSPRQLILFFFLHSIFVLIINQINIP